MKALWDPEAGRLLSLRHKKGIHKKAEEKDGGIRGMKRWNIYIYLYTQTHTHTTYIQYV